jgi:hypothetical protein
MPGETVSVSVQAKPKSSGVYLQNLTATIYYADQAGLHLISTQTIVSNPANSYGSYVTQGYAKNFTVSVPQNAPRTSLIAVFSETVHSTYYYGYPCVIDVFLGYCTFQYGWYTSNPYRTTIDDAIAPLSYIEATTPEYVSLQSTYQMVQQQLNQTQLQLKQSQTQNQQLQNVISQQNTTISQLNQQLASANAMTQTYQLVALGLGILAVVLAVFAIYQWSTKLKEQKTPEAPNSGET